MAAFLKLSDWEFKITMISMLRALIEKVNNSRTDGTVSREMGMLKNKIKKMLEIKKHCNRNEKCL